MLLFSCALAAQGSWGQKLTAVRLLRYFPPRDAIKTEQVYRAPVSNNGGPNPRASKGGRNTAQQIEAPSATIISEETLFDFDNTALLNFTILQKI